VEKKRKEMTLEDNIEWANLVRDQVCAVCGGDLVIEGVRETDSMRIVCKASAEHAGFRQRDTPKTELRRGQEVAEDVREKIESKMLAKTELRRALNILGLRFPDAIRDVAGAALFINDCMRLGLDPLIQPAEAIPIPFKTKDKTGREKITVAMIVTEDGALSMAARGCPDEYDGAPATMPYLNYLMREHPQRPLEDLEKVARRTAQELCDDAAAFVWVALGKRRSATVINPVYGYYRQEDWRKAKANKLPAGTQPGNQARVRAIKRWVRENFPEARDKMIEYTAELFRRSGGAREAQEIIDAEYSFITGPLDKKTPLISPPGGQTADGKGPKTAHNQAIKKGEKKVAETAERETEKSGGPGAGEVSPAAESGAGEDNLLSPQQRSDTPAARGASTETPPTEPPAVVGNGFRIEVPWLDKILKFIKWSEYTAKSWIASNLKVDTQGKLPEVLARLTREQAELFVRELQERAARVQPGLFD